MRKIYSRLLFLFTSFFLAGCITVIDEALPYQELPEAKTAISFKLGASPSHPTSSLSEEPIAANKTVEIIGSDLNAAYLLVLYKNVLGWMPSFYSSTNLGTLTPALRVEPLDGLCTTFVGDTYDPQTAWRSSGDDKVVVEGSIYRSEAANSFDAAALTVQIEGSGTAVASDYVHLELTPSRNLILFAYSLEGLTQGSTVTFDLANPNDEPLSFQATFFSDACGEDRSAGSRYEASLPIGQLQQSIPTVATPTPIPTDAPTDTSADESADESADDNSSDGDTVTPTPTRRSRVTVTPTPRETDVVIGYCDGKRGECTIDESEILRLLLRWDEIHHDADLNLDSSRLDEVLVGGALAEQEQTLRTLRRTSCYWEFVTIEEARILDVDHISANEAIVLSEKEWYGELFCKGRRTTILEDPFQVRYQIVRTDQGLRIAEKVPLDYIAPSLDRVATTTSRDSDTSTPDTSATETGYVCDDTYPTRLRRNTTAFLENERRNNVRTGPNTSNRLVGQIQPGEIITIIDGPECGEKMVWWYVESEDGIVGWTSEGIEGQYWLAPQQ